MGLGLVRKLKSRRKRGKPDVETGRIKEKGNIGDETHCALGLSVRNNGDRKFKLIDAEVRELNGEKVVQRGSVNESVVDSGDYVEMEAEFTFGEANEIGEEGNDLVVRIRTSCGGKLNTEMLRFEDVRYQA